MGRARKVVGARAGAVCVVLALAACNGGDGETSSLLTRAPVRGESSAGAPQVLGVGESVAYAMQLSSGGSLRIGGTVEGEGTLELVLTRAQASSGIEFPYAAPFVIHLEGGEFEQEIPLPSSGDAPLVAELTWRGEGAVHLEALDLIDEAPVERPSILFVSIDTLAASHLSTYGYERETTPNIDRLADEAVVFERCLANAPWTTPSYASQFTGLYAPVFESDPGERPDLLTYYVPPERWTLAERLAAAGYRTAAFVDNPVAGPEFGLSQGFELYDMSAAAISITEQAGGMRHLLPLAEDWLASLDDDEPFFLLVQGVDCHLPYLPPAEYAERFSSDALWDRERSAPVAQTTARYDALPRRAVMPLFDGDLPDSMPTAPFVDAYDAEIADIDGALGAFFESLEASGRLENTIIVFSADHGESMLDHRWFFGHGICYDEILHVPLIVRLPDGAHAARRVAQDVQLVDLVPTLAELAGLRLDPRSTHGRSLVPLLEGGTLDPVPILSGMGMHRSIALHHEGWKLIELTISKVETEIFLSHPRARAWIAAELGADHGDLTAEGLVAILAERGAVPQDYVPRLMEDLSDPIYELYHLAEDPGETRDLSMERPDVLARMKGLLETERARVEAARTLPSSDPETYELSDELMNEVEALGYAGD